MDADTGTTGTSSGLDSLKDKASGTMDRLSSTAQDAMSRVSAAASSAAERWDTTSRELMEAKDEYVETARGYIKEHPFTAIGIALAAGFLLSRLTR